MLLVFAVGPQAPLVTVHKTWAKLTGFFVFVFVFRLLHLNLPQTKWETKMFSEKCNVTRTFTNKLWSFFLSTQVVTLWLKSKLVFPPQTVSLTALLPSAAEQFRVNGFQSVCSETDWNLASSLLLPLVLFPNLKYHPHQSFWPFSLSYFSIPYLFLPAATPQAQIIKHKNINHQSTVGLQPAHFDS